MTETRKLRVFLCHASQDKPNVRELYQRLLVEEWIDPWLDEENLIPGQDWELEINRATRDADAIIVCLSKISVQKEGYVNKEIRRALGIAEEKLPGSVFIIPLRLDDCIPSFDELKKLHWADYFTGSGQKKLIETLRLRAEDLHRRLSDKEDASETNQPLVELNQEERDEADLDLYKFIHIDARANSNFQYVFWIAKYPVTNCQYMRFVNAPDFSEETHWDKLLAYDYSGQQYNTVNGVEWLYDSLRDPKISTDGEKIFPRYWNHEELGISHLDRPVVGITWYEANAYANWVKKHWSNLDESLANINLSPKIVRLPKRDEWWFAAGGKEPYGRYPWDKSGEVTTNIEKIVANANVNMNIGHTTPVDAYPGGASPFGVMDLAGNVWEILQNSSDKYTNALGLSWDFKLEQYKKSIAGYNYDLQFLDGSLRDPKKKYIPKPASYYELKKYSITEENFIYCKSVGPGIGFRLVSAPPQFEKIATVAEPEKKNSLFNLFWKPKGTK